MSTSTRRSVITGVVAVIIGALLAWAGSAGGASWRGTQLFIWAVAGAFVIQWVAFVPALIARTEKFYDLTGSATYLLITALLLTLVPTLGARGLLLGILVMVWAARLGLHLFTRVLKTGGDDRFDEIKQQPAAFWRVWTMQGLWVAMTASGAWIAITSTHAVHVDWLAWLGARSGWWASGSRQSPTSRSGRFAPIRPPREPSSTPACGRGPGTRTIWARLSCGSASPWPRPPPSGGGSGWESSLRSS